MALTVSTNMASITARKVMATIQREQNTSFAQLSSGSRITKAADDAAGLSISENLKSTIRGYGQAQRNANDGISLVQVAEGGLGEISNILTRLRELGVQAASDTVGDVERGFIDKEVQQLKNETQRIAESTRFGNTHLLDGSVVNSHSKWISITMTSKIELLLMPASKLQHLASLVLMDLISRTNQALEMH